MKILHMALVVVGAATIAAVVARAQAGTNPWGKAYQPTRLEWLASEANQIVHSHCVPETSSGFCTGTTLVASQPGVITVNVETQILSFAGEPSAAYDVRKTSMEAEVRKTFGSAKSIIATLANGVFHLPPPQVELRRNDSALTAPR